MGARRDRDYYPTTPDVARVLYDFLVFQNISGDWLDPCAGMGALLQWAFPTKRTCFDNYAIELHKPFNDELRQLARGVVIGDSFEERWVPYANVGQNPPFSQLERFVRRGLYHAETYNTWLCVLARKPWLSDGARQSLRKKLIDRDRMPHYDVDCCWRPSFDGIGTDNVPVTWHVWEPGPNPGGNTKCIRIERPIVPESDWTIHRAMTMAMPLAPQGELDLAQQETLI